MHLGGTKRTRAVIGEVPSWARPKLSKHTKSRDPAGALNSTRCLLTLNPALLSAGEVGSMINHGPSLEQASPRESGRKAWVSTGLKD